MSTTLEQEIYNLICNVSSMTDVDELQSDIIKVIDKHRPKPSIFHRYYLHGCRDGHQPVFLDTELNPESALSTAEEYLKMLNKYDKIQVSTLDESYYEIVGR